MTQAITYCASACTVRGQHLPDCACETTAHAHDPRSRPLDGGGLVLTAPEADREGQPIRYALACCHGCRPRPADHGRLCAWCWQKLNGDVVDAPALARYLWVLAHSGASAATSELPGRGGNAATRTVLHGALDALDGLHSCLAAWAHLVMDEHPHRRGMRGPDETGVRLTLTTKQLDPDVWPHLPGEPASWIQAPQVAGVRDPEATSRLVRWLLPLLAWCSEQEWAGEMRREVADVVRTTAARYPVAERTRAIPGVTCPVCENRSLVFDPPTVERHSTQVNCSTRGCGVVFTQEEFQRLTKIVEWEHEQERTA